MSFIIGIFFMMYHSSMKLNNFHWCQPIWNISFIFVCLKETDIVAAYDFIIDTVVLLSTELMHFIYFLYLWRESVRSDGQQFHQYQQYEQLYLSHQIIEHNKITPVTCLQAETHQLHVYYLRHISYMSTTLDTSATCLQA